MWRLKWHPSALHKVVILRFTTTTATNCWPSTDSHSHIVCAQSLVLAACMRGGVQIHSLDSASTGTLVACSGCPPWQGLTLLSYRHSQVRHSRSCAIQSPAHKQQARPRVSGVRRRLDSDCGQPGISTASGGLVLLLQPRAATVETEQSFVLNSVFWCVVLYYRTRYSSESSCRSTARGFSRRPCTWQAHCVCHHGQLQ